MPDSDRILDLLVEWEELRQQGKSVTAEHLCPDDSALQQALRSRIQKRERIHQLLDFPGDETKFDGAATAPTKPTIEGFEVQELLGRGGMGVVYSAREKGLNRPVALKMILAGANAGPQELSRFRAEAEAVARLQHSNIVQIYEIGQENGCPYLALELVTGGSLAQQLDGTPMAPRRAAQLVATLAQAVQHAHDQGIVHRDLKPANVLLTPDGTPKITDFGLAKRLDSDQGQTQTGTVIGSPSYMAPEQAEGKTRSIGPGTDIYALGTILYELLTGRPPFRASTMLDTLEQVRTHDPAPPRRLQPKIPRDLETICLKCLEKKPERRYGSAQALANDLKCYLDNEPIAARSSTLVDHLARAISQSRIDVSFRHWSTRTLTIAPLPFLIHLTVFLLLRGLAYYPVIALSVTGATVIIVLAITMFGHRTTMHLVPSEQRQRLYAAWFGHVIGLLLVPIVVIATLRPDDMKELFVIYPLWAIMAGLTFFFLASNIGIMYLVGGGCFVLALLATLAPSWAPLEVGLFMSANMTAQGLFMRRLGSDKPTGPGSETIADTRRSVNSKVR